MKVIFLDIDGVLNSHEWVLGLDTGELVVGVDRWIEMIDPAAVVLLNDIIEKTGAKVVISSTWRHRHDCEALQLLLEARGFKGEVVDRTPGPLETKVRRPDGTWFGPKMSLHPTRGDEIVWWLHHHPEVTEFVVLDDDTDMDGVRHRWVRTHYRRPGHPCGLHREAADRAIEMLNAGSSAAELRK